MAKRKVNKRKVRTKINKGIGVEFHSWTFFLFLLFVLVTVIILVSQQMGFRFF
ncbi:MAG: hypothetical protein ABSD69_00500 [Candidatus Levyibacteriota bacterium]